MAGVMRPYCRALVGLMAWSCAWGGAAVAEEGAEVRMNVLDAAHDLLGTESGLRKFEWRGAAAFTADGNRPSGASGHIDLSPALDEVFSFLHRHGVPLQKQVDEHGRGPVGVYADFHVTRDTPAVNVHLGDRPLEPIGAFYSSRHGFRCAIVWPVVDRFTLRLEAGNDSELGYFGIAGVQWVDPHRPVAIGIGVPMNMNGANGSVGLVFQLRMKLD